MSLVVVERRQHAVLIGLDRPEKRNALDAALVDEIDAVLRDAARAEPAVVVVYSRTPGMFVAGADLHEMFERTSEEGLQAINAGLFDRLEAHRWPTIAVIDGPALGGGCEFAMAFDLRVASARARFAQPELSLGLIAGAGGNWRLPQLVGLSLARRMLFTGESLDAQAALEAGLVDRVVREPDEVLDVALALADQIATRSWRAVELTKLALRQHRPATTSFDIVAQGMMLDSTDKRERITGFFDRQAAGKARPATG